MKRLESKRLKLRSIELSRDLEPCFKYKSHKSNKDYGRVRWHETKEQTEQYLTRLIALQKADIALSWAITLKNQPDIIIGIVTFYSKEFDDDFDEKYNVLKELFELEESNQELFNSLRPIKVLGAFATVEIAFNLSPEHWGKGYMPEALIETVCFLFEISQIRRIEAKVDPTNEQSCKMLNKIGFKKEGILRKAGSDDKDEIMYSLIKDQDWETIEQYRAKYSK